MSKRPTLQWGKDFLELLHPQRAHYECVHGKKHHMYRFN